MNLKLTVLAGWLGISTVFLCIFLYLFLFTDAKLTPVIAGLILSFAFVIAAAICIRKIRVPAAAKQSAPEKPVSAPPAEQPPRKLIVEGDVFHKETMFLADSSVQQIAEVVADILKTHSATASTPVPTETTLNQPASEEKKPEPTHFLVYKP